MAFDYLRRRVLVRYVADALIIIITIISCTGRVFIIIRVDSFVEYSKRRSSESAGKPEVHFFYFCLFGDVSSTSLFHRYMVCGPTTSVNLTQYIPTLNVRYNASFSLSLCVSPLMNRNRAF